MGECRTVGNVSECIEEIDVCVDSSKSIKDGKEKESVEEHIYNVIQGAFGDCIKGIPVKLALIGRIEELEANAERMKKERVVEIEIMKRWFNVMNIAV